MKKFALLLLVVCLLVFGFGCSNQGKSEGESKSASNGTNAKQVEITFKNATNETWVLDKTSFGSQEYRGELDAIDAESFKVEPGGVFASMSGTADDYADSEFFTENSETTYEYKIQLIAGGPMPMDEDEQYVYDPFVAVEDFVVQGAYGKPVTVEWDGTIFKQMD